MGNDDGATPSKSDKALSPVQEQPVVQPYPDWAAMQPLMSPFGTPYAAIYAHGVYPHPSMVSPSTPEAPTKSSSSKERRLMKKLKGFDGLAVSIGNVNADITVAEGNGQSQSEENGVEGSSDASDENDSGGKENPRKRATEPTLGDMKALETNATLKGIFVSPSPITCKPPCTLPASSQLKADAHPEPLTKDERELKRERRKQSNRESARRSRLRKQAETEELAIKVESLNAENMTLRSELNQLKENSEKLKVENSSLLVKMMNGEDISPDKLENQDASSVVVENFLSRIDELRQDENRESSNGGKLCQLLDSNSRTDAVVAG